MVKFASIMVVMACVLIVLPSAQATESGPNDHSGTSARMNTEEYGSLYGTIQAQLPPIDVVDITTVEQKEPSCPHDQSPAKGVAQQEWNRNDDFPGPGHSGLERRFVWP
jgi:hypothetical protein